MEKARLKAEQEEKERKGAIKVSFLHASDLQCVHHIIHVFCVHVCRCTYMSTCVKGIHKNKHVHVLNAIITYT